MLATGWYNSGPQYKEKGDNLEAIKKQNVFMQLEGIDIVTITLLSSTENRY